MTMLELLEHHKVRACGAQEGEKIIPCLRAPLSTLEASEEQKGIPEASSVLTVLKWTLNPKP